MIQIAIVDDHAIVRTGLRQFLGEQGDLRVAGGAAKGREAWPVPAPQSQAVPRPAGKAARKSNSASG